MATCKGDGVLIPKGKDKHGKPVWEIQYSNGTKPDGSRRRASRTVHGTKAEANKVLKQLQRDAEKGLQIDQSKQLFRDFADTWHARRVQAGALAPTSVKREKAQIELLKKHLGNIEIGKINPATIESAYQAIRSEKTAARGSYSETTMRSLHGKLKQILKKAVDYDLILRNPCERVDAPKTESVDRRSLSRSEGARLLRAVDESEAKAFSDMQEKNARVMADHQGTRKGTESLYGMKNISNIIAVRIGLATGMRRGEVLGLKWSDVDLVQSGCKVSGRIRTRHNLDTLGNYKDTKTKASCRDISIDQATAASLLHWKQEQARLLKFLGIRQTNETPVVCSSTGGFMNGSNFYKWWCSWSAAQGFAGLRFHELRHTQATLLLGNRVDVKTVQARLGHANASITLNYYAHAIPENDAAAADLFGNLLNEPEEKPASNVVQFATKTA